MATPEANVRAHQLRQNLLAIGQEILHQSDVRTILRQVAQAIREHSPFQLVGIILFEQAVESGKKERIAQMLTSGLSEEEEAKLREIATSGTFIPCQRILEKGKALGSGYYVTPEMIPEIIPKGIKGKVSQPGAWGAYDNLYFLLRQEEKIIGRLSLGDPVHGQVPTPEELAPLELFVNLATLALEKARYTEELSSFQRRLQGIYRLSERLARLEDLDELTTQAVETIREHFPYDHITLFLKEGNTLVRRGFHTILPLDEIRFERFARLDLGKGVCGWVAEHQQPALIGDVRRDPRHISGHPAIRSELAVPIEEKGNLIGVLNIESVKEDAFTHEDLELLQALARQLAGGLSNIHYRQHLQEIVEEQEWSNRFLQSINAAQEFEDVLTMVIRHGIDLLYPKANAGSFLVWDESKKLFEFRATIQREDLEPLKKKITLRREDVAELTVLAHGPVILTRTLQLAHPELNIIWKRFGQLPPPSTIAVPIQDGEHVIAVLNINNLDKEGVFTQEDAQKLQALVPEIELALSRARDHERFREMALRDSLTGVYNRHYFTEFIVKKQEGSGQNGYPISLVMVDMDSFYEVNDRFGHAEGDRVLHEVAQLLMKGVRTSDIVVRYGGDEFLIIMPQTAKAKATKAMERLRQKLEKWDPKLSGMRISISFGVSSWTPKGSRSLGQVLEQADEFMYHRRRASSRARRVRKQAIIATPTSYNTKKSNKKK